MKIIVTEEQYNLLKESLVDDTEFRETIKSFESTVTDSKGNHYTFDDKDPKNPKTFIKGKSPYGGVLTIGWGHTGDKAKPGKKISNSEAERLLTQDIKKEEQKAKNLFPKYDTYPIYVQRTLTNATYRGEAKSGYEWVKLINSGNWDLASKKYLEGWNVDFSQAKNPRYKGGVADRMVKNQEAFKKYAKELKSTKIPEKKVQEKTPNQPQKKHLDIHDPGWLKSRLYGKKIYATKTVDTDFVNVRNSPEVNNGLISNKIATVKYPNIVGVAKDAKMLGNESWIWVELDPSVGVWDEGGWVMYKYVQSAKP